MFHSDRMRVTLDTNVFGPVASPMLYTDAPQIEALRAIRQQIESGNIQPFISEASISLEGLTHADRIDVFIRAWDTQRYPIELPKLPEQRVEVISNALSLGIRVLHVPRVALGSFYELTEGDWATDAVFSVSERLDRYSNFARAFPTIGSGVLKQLGAELVDAHAMDKKHLEHLASLASWPTASEMMWMKGLVKEFDCPTKFPTQKAFIKHVREIIAEWCDLDILASHYAYGNDVFCTLDSAKGTGSTGILHPTQRNALVNNFGLTILSPEELVRKIASET